MRIHEIGLREIEFPLFAPFRAAAGEISFRRTILVEVHAGDVVGVGELSALPDPTYTSETLRGERHVLVRYLIPAVLDYPDGFDVGGRQFDDVVRHIRGHRMAKAALSLALADAAAAQSGVPLGRHWGGTRQTVPPGVVLGFTNNPDRLLEQVTRALAEGYRRIKLKIAPGRDLIPLTTVRRAFPDVALAADANGCYCADDELWSAIDALDLAYIEEPLTPGSWAELSRLRSRLATPIALDESIVCPISAETAIQLGAADVFNVKLSRVGGVAPARAIHDLAVEAGMDAFVGGMLDSCVGRVHQLALASLPGFTVPGDIGGTDRYSPIDLVRPPIRIGDGGLPVSAAAGVAAILDPDALKRITLRLDRFPASP